MANNKRRRPQTQKIVRTRSIETRDFLLDGRGGVHKAKNAYTRQPKHRNQGWGE